MNTEDIPNNYYFYAFWATSNNAFEKNENVLEIIEKDAELIKHPVLLMNKNNSGR